MAGELAVRPPMEVGRYNNAQQFIHYLSKYGPSALQIISRIAPDLVPYGQQILSGAKISVNVIKAIHKGLKHIPDFLNHFKKLAGIKKPRLDSEAKVEELSSTGVPNPYLEHDMTHKRPHLAIEHQTQDSDAVTSGLNVDPSLGGAASGDAFYYPAIASYDQDVFHINVKRRVLLENTTPVWVGGQQRKYLSWYTISASNIYNYLPDYIRHEMHMVGHEYYKLTDIECKVQNAWYSSEMVQTTNERDVSDRPEIAYIIDKGVALKVNDNYSFALQIPEGLKFADTVPQTPVTYTYNLYAENADASPMVEYFVHAGSEGSANNYTPPILAYGKYKVWNGDDPIVIRQPDQKWKPIFVDTVKLGTPNGTPGPGNRAGHYTDFKSFYQSHSFEARETHNPLFGDDGGNHQPDITINDAGHMHVDPAEVWFKMFTPPGNNTYKCYLTVTFKATLHLKRTFRPYAIRPTPIEDVNFSCAYFPSNLAGNLQYEYQRWFPYSHRWLNMKIPASVAEAGGTSTNDFVYYKLVANNTINNANVIFRSTALAIAEREKESVEKMTEFNTQKRIAELELELATLEDQEEEPPE